jgi:hypothetical protein
MLNVTQGSFFKDPKWNKHGTMFASYVEENPIYGWEVLIGDLILPDPETMQWTSFPEGSGPIATITFQGIYQDLTENYCTLTIAESCLTDDKGENISTAPSVNGFYYILREFHDVAVTDVTPSVTEAYAGWIVEINVTVANQGYLTETFDLTAYYDLMPIETRTIVDLTSGTNVTVTFAWNTAGLAFGNYTIRAEASMVVGEQNMENNIFIDDIVRIKMSGDVNGDNKIDIEDIAIAALAFGSFPDHPRWNNQIDINQDGKVDIADLVLIAINFGKTYP